MTAWKKRLSYEELDKRTQLFAEDLRVLSAFFSSLIIFCFPTFDGFVMASAEHGDSYPVYITTQLLGFLMKDRLFLNFLQIRTHAKCAVIHTFAIVYAFFVVY